MTVRYVRYSNIDTEYLKWDKISIASTGAHINFSRGRGGRQNTMVTVNIVFKKLNFSVISFTV